MGHSLALLYSLLFSAQWHSDPGTEELETVVFPELLKPKTETRGLLILIAGVVRDLGNTYRGWESTSWWLKNLSCSYLVLIKCLLILCSRKVMYDFPVPCPPPLPFLHSTGANRGLRRELLHVDFLQKCSPTPSFPSLQMFACCSHSLACVWESLKPWLPNFPHDTPTFCQIHVRVSRFAFSSRAQAVIFRNFWEFSRSPWAVF